MAATIGEMVVTKYNGKAEMADRGDVMNSDWSFTGHDELADGTPVDVFVHGRTCKRVAVLDATLYRVKEV